MSEDTIHAGISELVPASIVNSISSYTFYDDHPLDSKLIDVITCSNCGEVQEFYQRDVLNSLLLENSHGPYSIKTMRNGTADLFYLVQSSQDLFIISRKEILELTRRINNVEKYEIDDPTCSGKLLLKIYQKNEEFPLVLDDDFANINKDTVKEDPSCLVIELQRKLSEAKYNLECNRKTYEDLINLRQMATYSVHQKIHDGFDGVHLKSLKKTIEPKLKMTSPIVKYCNKKIVILINAINQYSEIIEDIHIILRNGLPSLTYQTKLFKKHKKSPYWIEGTSNMQPYSEATIVAVLNLNELSNSSFSKAEFNGVVTFKRESKEYLVPFEQVVISSLDVLGEKFDVLHGNLDDPLNILAALTTTLKINLTLRIIDVQKPTSPKEELSQNLGMEEIPNLNNALIHKKSPYHRLNGLIILFNDDSEGETNLTEIVVHSRSPSQVIDLIHYIHDAVPYKIVITTSDQKLTSKLEKPQHSDHEVPQTNNLEYASSILSRTGVILEYLDRAIVKMNESADLNVRNKIGSKIDLSACGDNDYKVFKENMIELGAKGIEKMLGTNISDDEVEEIVID